MRFVNRLIAISGLGIWLVACASYGNTRHASGYDPTVVYRDELAQFDGRPLTDALAYLRPRMLVNHGEVPKLAMDGLLLMNNDPLKTLQASDIYSCRLLDGPTATVKYGSRAGGAVLEVTTRRR